MKKLIILTAALCALLCACASADPARTDGTVTAWIGEENGLFLKCTDGVTRRLSAPMKDILGMTETEVVSLTQTNQIVSVKKDGSGYRILSASATADEISADTDRLFTLTDGKLTAGETVFSERAAAAASDGTILYWVNRGENGYILMQKEMPGKEQEAAGRMYVSLTGISVPEPVYLNVTGEALTLTAADRSIVSFSLRDGETKSFPASGQVTTAACMADNRLYRYISTETVPWMLETIQNDAMQLTTVTPAPTSAPTPVPTPVPTVTPRVTAVPTAVPRPDPTSDGNIYKGTRGRTVRKIQQRLHALGYPVGNTDGIYGEQTQIAVNLFYDAIHVRERSYITPSMYRRLFAADAPAYDPYLPLQKGDRGLSVLYMQMMLRKIGYNTIKVDGIYGALTVAAVAEYQKVIGYIPAEKEVPGEYASRELLEKLLGPEPTPSPTPQPTNTPKPTVAPTKIPDPVTDPPVTDPVTDPPVTDPVTDPPVTDPVTDPPVTDPVTDPPVSDPVTDPPVTDTVTDPVTDPPETDPETNPGQGKE